MTPPRPDLSLAAHVDAGPDTYEFETADGLVSSGEFRDEELLLLEVLWERNVGRLLVVQANYGVVGTVLAAQAQRVTMTETSARAARLCRRNVATNDAEDTADVELVESPSSLDERFDIACYAPAGYTPINVGKQRIVDALAALDPGGTLYVAASKETGLTRYRDCLTEHAAAVGTVTKQGRYRVLEATRPAAFSPPTYDHPREFDATVDGVALSLVTRQGLFSPTGIDDGTRLLLETVTVDGSETVLDLACGYGTIGAYAASITDGEVLLTDDDVRATWCAERTLAATGVDGTVVTADGTRGIDQPVDLVLSNPPTHAGSGVLTEFCTGVAELLVAGGRFSVVHHRTLDLDDYLERVGSIVDRTYGEEHTVVTVAV